MKIGQVARRLGTTVRTLRFYEEEGLITPGRTAGGTRHYSEEDLGRFETILKLAALGFSLAELRELAAARPGSRSGNQASRRVHALLGQMAGELAERRRQIEAAERDLARAGERVAQCFGCTQRPTRIGCAGCDIAADLLAGSEVMRLVWDEAN